MGKALKSHSGDAKQDGIQSQTAGTQHKVSNFLEQTFRASEGIKQ